MKERIYLNNQWQFYKKFDEKITANTFNGPHEEVRIPHSVAVTPFNNFNEDIFEGTYGYRKVFATTPQMKGKKVLLTFEGAAHNVTVFLNGKIVAEHKCAYTSFTVDISKFLSVQGKNNVLAVKLEINSELPIPPFGGSVDFLPYGGIYRDVYIDLKNDIYITDVFVRTAKNHFTSTISLNSALNTEGWIIQQNIVQELSETKKSSGEIITGISNDKVHTSIVAQPVKLWTLEKPVLYLVTTELFDSKGKLVDSVVTRFGFRDLELNSKGFYLNGIKTKLRGLHREQSYPYVGYAMPERLQKKDADILKYQLGCNMVSVSHTPASESFLDRCDEIGLLVYEEIPGDKFLGGDQWKEQCIQNLNEMILQHRNHPSIFMWGTRVSDTVDCDDFYTRTNSIGKKLDPGRFTCGNRSIKKSNLIEDVYAFDDYTYSKLKPVLNRKSVFAENQLKLEDKAFFTGGFAGLSFPVKNTDNEERRTEQAVLHADIINAIAGDDSSIGGSGFTAFDYNTHREFGASDHICYHGVMDMFRNPKLAAFMYKSQGEYSDSGDVLEITSSLDLGERNGGLREPVYILTNCDSVKMFMNNIFIKVFSKEDSPYKYIPHGPILIDDYIGTRLMNEDHIPAEKADAVKKLLALLERKDIKDFNFKEKISLVKLHLLGIITKKKLLELYQKYYVQWRKNAATYRFEGCRDGKVVKTVIKTPCTTARVLAHTDSTELFEGNTYDVQEIHIEARDENNNLLSYYQEAVSLKSSGSIEILGPKVISLKGGMAATYVKTNGKVGRGSLVITDCFGNDQQIDFSVKQK